MENTGTGQGPSGIGRIQFQLAAQANRQETKSHASGYGMSELRNIDTGVV